MTWLWIFLISTFPMVASAVIKFDNSEFATKTGLGTNDPTLVTIGIVQAVLAVLGLIAVAFIIYAGLLWIFSGGNADTIKKAQGILRSSIVGLLIILASYGIAQYAFNIAVNATGAPK